ncbi:MAG: hypothetical protein PUF49_07290 [Firmicutes bacterium]|nr:hypothetical protein [Bacillota bacterium]
MNRNPVTNGSYYRIRAEHSRKSRERQLRRYYTLALCGACLAVILCFLIFGLRTKASADPGRKDYKYYTSVLLTSDKDINYYASMYGDRQHYRSSREYIAEVCNINHIGLKDGYDTVDAAPGNYIIVPYYSTELR